MLPLVGVDEGGGEPVAAGRLEEGVEDGEEQHRIEEGAQQI